MKKHPDNWPVLADKVFAYIILIVAAYWLYAVGEAVSLWDSKSIFFLFAVVLCGLATYGFYSIKEKPEKAEEEQETAKKETE